MFFKAKNSDYLEVIKLAKALLTIDYTCLYAQKYLQQSYKFLGDSINQKKYHDIEFGLIHSITDSADGKTCETAWDVIQIEEEYFLFNMLGVRFTQLALVQGKVNICDKMDGLDDDGKSVTYYFGVRKMFTSYSN